MSAWKTAFLGDVATIIGGGTPTRNNPDFYGGPIPWVTPKDMKSWEIHEAQVTITQSGLDNSATRLVPVNSVLMVVRSGVLKHTIPVAVNRRPVAINQDMKALLCGDKLDVNFLARFVKAQSPIILQWVRATTADNFAIDRLRKLEVPVPPLAEQRRIAEVLDRAEVLRAKRRAALEELDSLTRALFLNLFGDPAANTGAWPVLHLGDSLSMPLRNGLSPSHSGKVIAKVLTLSAITGSEFDASAWKTSTFQTPPPSEQAVNENDFLICRGNGNLQLVGKGYFPTESMSDVTFPDTVIAARVSPERIDRAFFQHVWNSNAVRRQIESLARTTNGTFKVNQAILEAISFVVPLLSLQREFARRVAAVEKLKATYRASMTNLDALFASLQHRAFRGEL